MSLGRKRFAVVGLVILAVMTSFIASCGNREARHRILTFFFDGVPSPNGEQAVSEQDNRAGTSQPTEPGDSVEQIWYSHQARKDCDQCHGERTKRSFSRQVRLVATVPDLCFKCHDNYAETGRYLHGPVAVGQCLFCHHHHRSRYKRLLNRPQPGLCYMCHDQADIEAINEHRADILDQCTRCHEPHVSSMKHLLRVNQGEIPEAPTEPTEPNENTESGLSDNM